MVVGCRTKAEVTGLVLLTLGRIQRRAQCEVVAQLDALVADVDGRPSNQFAYFVLALAAEGTVESLWCRPIILCRHRRREFSACTRGSFDFGGQDVPVVIAEHGSDQFPALAVGGFNGPPLQGIAQGVRHGLRIAKIARKSTSSLANGGDRACLADPFANGEGGVRLIRSPSPRGRRRRVHRPC